MAFYTRICEICNEPFQSKSPSKRICYKDHYKQCPYCGVSVKWNSYLEFHGCKPCIYTEAAKKRKITMQSKYGAPTTLQSKELTDKVKNTLIHKYGVSNVGKSKEIQEKRKCTNKERYGVTNPMQNAEIAKKSAEHRKTKINSIIQKTRQTWLAKYGVDNVFKSKEIQDRIKQSLLRKYGYDHPMDVPEIRQKFEQTCIDRYGVPYFVLSEKYRQNNHFRISKANIFAAEILQKLNISYELEYNIGRKCYDIYVPERNTLIEINPSYTHNIVGSHWNKQGIPKSYHEEKTQIAENAGYRCIHIWDWDDVETTLITAFPNKQISADELDIYKLNSDVCNQFLKANALHFSAVTATSHLCIGLVKNQTIYQVMTFKKAKHQPQYQYQIHHICTKQGYEVHEGLDKLSTTASEVFSICSCIAYADVSKPWIASAYQTIGMKLQKHNPPNLIWSKGTRCLWNYIAQLQNQSETDLIHDGWLPIYDCGTDVYVFE